MSDQIDAVMRTDFPRLGPDTPIRDAVAALLNADSNTAPVLDDDGSLVGVLTQRDCFRPALNAGYYQQWSGKVADYLTADVVALQSTDDMVAAAEAFLDRPYHSFPVLQDGRLVGMLRRSDLLRAFLDLG